MSVDALIEAVIGREGGYSNHPADRGGPTNWGITEQVARAYGYKGAMQSLPRGTAVEIYRRRYWTGPGFDKVAATFPRLAEELFDTGINMGPAVAVTFLQRALNVLNRQAADYPDIGADGQIGPMTITALKGYAVRRGGAGSLGETVLMRACDGLQAARYIELAERNASQEAFVFGWLANRVGTLG